MLNITNIYKIEIKTMKYHFIPTKITKLRAIKKLGNIKCRQGCKETGTLMFFKYECTLEPPFI